MAARRAHDDHLVKARDYFQAMPSQDQYDSNGPVSWTFLRRRGDSAPACTICGRQDETLRVVSYPFVISLLFITYRKAFTGLWCARHRRLRRYLASVITATIGWIGIPFGFLYTPWALFKLAEGGIQPAQSNVQMLEALSEHKLKNGDVPGAIRCLEACLRFREDDKIKARLRELSMRIGTPDGEPLGSGIPVLVVLLGSILVGLFVGLGDYATAVAFGEWFPDKVSIYIIILAWALTVLLIFLAGLILLELIEWGIASLQSRQLSFGITLAALSAALAFNFLLTGETLGRYLDRTLRLADGEPAREAGITVGAILTRGSLLAIPTFIQSGDLATFLYPIILAVGAVYLFAMGISTARQVVRWQQRVLTARVNIPATANGALSWFMMSVIPLGIVGLAVVYPQKGVVDYFEAIQHNRQGNGLLEQEQTEQAAAEFRAAAELRPGWSIPHANLGWVLYDQHKYPEAIEELQQAIRLDPTDAETYAGLGTVYQQQDNDVAAKEMYEEAIKRDPKSGLAYRNLGFLYLSQDNYQAARDNLEIAVQLGPRDPIAREGLATVYLWQGEEKAATSAFENVLTLDPKNGNAHVQLGMLLLYQDNWDEATRHLTTALELSPNAYGTRYALGILYASKGQWEEAITHLEKAIAINPRSPGVYDWLYTIYRSSGQTDKLAASLDTVVREQPTWSVPHSLLADVYFDLDQAQLMERELRQAEELAGSDPEAYYYLASVHYQQQQFAEAEALIRRSIELSPKDATYYLVLSSVYLAQKKFDQASQAIDQAVTFHKEYADAFVSRANIYQEQGRLEQALAELKQALKVAPGNPHVHSALSLLYLQQSQYDDALKEAKELLRLAPYSSSAQLSLAFAYHGQGEIDQALAAAQQAVKITPKSDLAHYVLGLCFVSKGENKQAVAEFERFLNLYWDRSYARDYKAKAEQYITQLR